jgi:hypothetical protein
MHWFHWNSADGGEDSYGTGVLILGGSSVDFGGEVHAWLVAI